MVIGQTYNCVCTKNATIDPFFSYIGATYSRGLKNATISFFFLPYYIQVPAITYKFPTSQLPVRSQHHIQCPNITTSCYIPTSQVPTTNLEQQVPNTKLPKDIYIYTQVLYITKNIQEGFFYIQNCPQIATSSKQQHHVCVNKNIYVLMKVCLQHA